MKRTELKRGAGLSRNSRLQPGKRHARADRALAAVTGGDIAAARAAMHTVTDFWEAARAQGICQVTGKCGPWDSHHVIEKDWLRRHGKDPWDPRNALRILDGIHANHTGAHERIPMRCLRQENIDFAFETMSAGAHFYLRRRYAGYDERVELALAESEYRAARPE